MPSSANQKSGLQNRNASGFQMLDKANPGLVTSPRSEALPHDRKAVVVAGRFRH
jgi:hypothetical protein